MSHFGHINEVLSDNAVADILTHRTTTVPLVHAPRINKHDLQLLTIQCTCIIESVDY
jgi:hypothetical protein